MEVIRITEWVDIQAPREEVFNLVVDLERRMQLSPLWGVASIENPSTDYPLEGSSYDVQIPEKEDSCFETIITAFKPLQKLAYQSIFENTTKVSWNLQEVQQGTRLIYTEEFLSAEGSSSEVRETVKKIVQQWLKNMQRYAELRDTWTKRMFKWLVDRFYLKLRPDQRRTVLTILYMQVVGTITFVMAALALGVASFFT